MSQELTYLAFNNRVIALERASGKIRWDWKTHQGRGYVALLPLDEDLFVSVNGYTYCLGSRHGEQKWYNSMPGFGIGAPCLASHPSLADRVFIGFNRRVAALDRRSGNILWDWKSGAGYRYVALSAGENELICSVAGYTWALSPQSGRELWHNPLQGYGMGVASLSSTGDSSSSTHIFGASADDTRRSS